MFIAPDIYTIEQSIENVKVVEKYLWTVLPTIWLFWTYL